MNTTIHGNIKVTINGRSGIMSAQSSNLGNTTAKEKNLLKATYTEFYLACEDASYMGGVINPAMIGGIEHIYNTILRRHYTNLTATVHYESGYNT